MTSALEKTLLMKSKIYSFVLIAIALSVLSGCMLRDDEWDLLFYGMGRELEAEIERELDGLRQTVEDDIRYYLETARNNVQNWIEGIFSDNTDGMYENGEERIPLNLVIYRTRQLHTYDEYGNLAEDMLFAHKSVRELLNVHTITRQDFALSVDMHRALWEATGRFFSRAPLQRVILDMIDNFMYPQYIFFEDPVLTRAARNHPNTVKYVEFVKQAIHELLQIYQGDIMSLAYIENNRLASPLVMEMLNDDGTLRIEQPVFNTWHDRLNGLTFAVHGLFGNEVVVRYYSFDNWEYEITLTFTLYDHFGLDSGDMEGIMGEYRNLPTDFVGYLPGFRSWYILQHYIGFLGAYRPFVTVMSFDVTFMGNIVPLTPNYAIS